MRDSNFVSAPLHDHKNRPGKKTVPFRPRIPDHMRDQMRELLGGKNRQMNELAIRYIEEGIARDKEKFVMTLAQYAAQHSIVQYRVQIAYIDAKDMDVSKVDKDFMNTDHEIDDETLRKMNTYFGFLNKAKPE